MKYTTAKNHFCQAALAFIPHVWRKRKNPISPDRESAYPGRVTEVLELTVDGQDMVFFVSIVGRSKAELEQAAPAIRKIKGK